MKKFKIILLYLINIHFILTMEVSSSLSQRYQNASRENILEELQSSLTKEGKKKGIFIKEIVNGLKQCSNYNLFSINYLTLKSSYWYDKKPKISRMDNYYLLDDMELYNSKIIMIDRKSRSAVYSRDGVKDSFPLGQLFQKYTNQDLSQVRFVNSWDSVKNKFQFFRNENIGNAVAHIGDLGGIDIGSNPIFDKELDTYPSVFQIMKVAKSLKPAKESEKCPLNLKEIEKQKPAEVIIKELQALYEAPFYKEFSAQNHPLRVIIQDHLNKLMYKAQTKDYFSSLSQGTKDNIAYNRTIFFSNLLSAIGKMIKYMSVFNINMDKGICEIPGLKVLSPYILYTQFYEIINDLLFVLMATEHPYDMESFQTFFNNAYTARFPILESLEKSGVVVESYPMRSGMDAFVNTAMAINYAPQQISIAPKVANLENKVYYEIDHLLNLFNNKRSSLQTITVLTNEMNQERFHQMLTSMLEAYLQSKGTIDLKEGDKPNSIEDAKERLWKKFKELPFQRKLGIIYYPKGTSGEELKAQVISKLIEEIKQSLLYHPKNILNQVKIGQHSFLKHAKDQWNFYESLLTTYLESDDVIQVEKSNRQDSIKEAEEKLINNSLDEINISFNPKERLGTIYYAEGENAKEFKSKVISALVTNIKSLCSYNDIKDSLKGFLTHTKQINKFQELQKIIYESQTKYNYKITELIKALHVIKKEYPELGNTIELDDHPSLTAGMTTDTIDQSHNSHFVNELFAKLNLIRSTKKELSKSAQPFIILWDTTLEINRGPGYTMIEKFQEDIKKGDVIFILFKSLQKYANLGIGKTKAGVTTVIGNSKVITPIQKKLQKYAQDVWNHHSEELQLMTFFHDWHNTGVEAVPFQDNEAYYYKAVAKHAENIHQKTLDDVMDANNNKEHRFDISGGCLFDKRHPYPNNFYFSDTFGFCVPTCLSIENGLTRYSVGLNPKGLFD